MKDGAEAEGTIAPTDLRCEYLSDPLGLDVAHPRFSWVCSSGERGRRQASYQIIVATTEAKLEEATGDAWDTGRVRSSGQTHIEYSGIPLESGTRYHWKVRLWDQDGGMSSWSASACFETGLLKPEDWQGKWIARQPDTAWRKAWDLRRKQQKAKRFKQPDHELWDVHAFFQPSYEALPLFRKEVELGADVVSARAYICGLGYNELYVNGKKVGTRVLDPAWTSYDKRVLYSVYDVSDYFQQGQNTIGVALGRGWYTPIWGIAGLDGANWVNQPRFILQLHLTHKDGSRSIVASDATWHGTDGPVLFDCVMSGEIHDARKEVPGWNKNDCPKDSWRPACEVDAPEGELRAQTIQPIRVTETIQPVRTTRPRDGVTVYDFGKNISGWVRIKVRGGKGTRVTMDFKETLNPDGTVEKSVGGNPSRHTQAVYVLSGKEIEEYEPRFAYWGFQYVEVTHSRDPGEQESKDGLPFELLKIEGRFVHTDVKEAGRFACSDSLVNRLHQNILQSFRGNFHGMQTDCPTREKIGWTGDVHPTAETAIYNFGMARLYTKWLDDLKDRQEDHGRIPAYAPRQAHFPRKWDAPPWTIAYVLVPWQMYRYYGDRRILEEHYPNMKTWLQGIEARCGVKGKPRIVKGGASDWAAPPNYASMKEGSLFWGTLFYYHSADMMSRVARALDREEDAKAFAHLAGEIKEIFNATFFDPKGGIYKVEKHTAYRQAANVVPLYLGIVPEAHRDAVAEKLIHDIAETRKGHLWTGILGTRYLMEWLPQSGENELAFTVLTNKTWPGWGYQILEHDATTLWEYWKPRRSRNHPMFGSVGSYLYKYLAGIRHAPDSLGFETVEFRPHVPKALSWVDASYDSVRGTIACRWAKEGDRFTLKVTLPANTRGVVRIPTFNRRNPTVKEGGRVIWENGTFQPKACEHIRHVENAHGPDGTLDTIHFAIESGQYVFQLSGH